MASSQCRRCCQYRALKSQIRLRRVGPHSSSVTWWRLLPPLRCACSSAATAVATSSASPAVLRRRSSASSSAGPPTTGRSSTGARKLCRYCTQSATTRSRDRSTPGVRRRGRAGAAQGVEDGRQRRGEIHRVLARPAGPRAGSQPAPLGSRTGRPGRRRDHGARRPAPGSPARRARSRTPSRAPRPPRGSRAAAGWSPRRWSRPPRPPGPAGPRAAGARTRRARRCPGTLVRMNSSARSERIGPTPASTAQRSVSPRSTSSAMNRRNSGRSNTNWVWQNWAPAAIFLPSRVGRNASGGANGFSTAPIRKPGGGIHRAAGQQHALVAHGAGGPDQLHAVQVVDRLGLRVVAEPRVVAGQQQHVRDAQGGRRDQVRLQRDPVAVPAGQLHHRLHPGPVRQHAAGQAGQPHVRALVVGDVGRVHPAAQVVRPCG